MVQPNPTSPLIPLSAARPVAHSTLLRTSVPHWQEDLWERWLESLSPPHQNHPNPLAGWSGYGREGAQAEYLWQVGMEKGSRRPLDLLRCPLGRKGVADFPPLRVCEVNVTRITRKIFKILNLVFGNLSFFPVAIQHHLFAHGTQRKTGGRQTGPLSRKVSRQIDHRSPWSGRQKYFWSQMATRRPDFSSPAWGYDLCRKLQFDESCLLICRGPGMSLRSFQSGQEALTISSDSLHAWSLGVPCWVGKLSILPDSLGSFVPIPSSPHMRCIISLDMQSTLQINCFTLRVGFIRTGLYRELLFSIPFISWPGQAVV